MGDYNRVSKGYKVDLLSQKGLQVGFGVEHYNVAIPGNPQTLNP